MDAVVGGEGTMHVIVGGGGGQGNHQNVNTNSNIMSSNLSLHVECE